MPARSYGPRVASLSALCGGAYRLSNRLIASFCADVLGVPLAVGEICEVEQTVAQAVEPPVQAARTYIQTQDANVEETSWRQQQRRAWLWSVGTQGVRVFDIRPSRSAKVLKERLGVGDRASLTSDRAQAYNCQPVPQRQLCWAPLRRNCHARSDCRGAGAAVGESLLEHTEVLFGWWDWVRDGSWSPATWQRYRRGLRQSVRGEVEAGARSACAKPAPTCRELADLFDGLLPGFVCWDSTALLATANSQLALLSIALIP